MGAGKVIGIILLIIILIIGVIGVDIYMTVSALTEVDPDSLVGNPQYENENNNTIKISVDVSLPNGGFIPKGIILTLIIEIDTLTDTETQEINLGDTETLIFSFTLTTDQTDTLVSGGELSVSSSAEVTPVYFGFEVSAATQEIDLGTTTIS